ncbi:MAG: exodeoxyribonuclease VII large subunit [Pseudomonadota bacterium]|nr:exodeoxyribonuclease VII large subunit [Pseudomonadota bacterium]
MSQFQDTDNRNANVQEFSVSEISGLVKRQIEDGFAHIRVRAELGRVSRPASGHLYLDLKDEKAVLSGVIWKGTAQKLPLQPEQGLEVICTGKLTTFAGQSKYQMIIEYMEPAGVGALMALLEERKKKLTAEGLFEPSRKKMLPFLPQTIGVVTSPSGAVIRDIIHRLEDRFPRHVLVWPVRVQGENCAEEVSRAIASFNAIKPGGTTPRPDILIVARGGGSFEDLWGFNEEIVVRTVAQSDIPIISAIGHETDTTLIDFAADIRAPTPTAAAEMAVPVKADLTTGLMDLTRRMMRSSHAVLTTRRDHLTGLSRGMPRLEDILAIPRQLFDSISSRLGRALTANLTRQLAQFELIAGGLSFKPMLGHIRQSRQSISGLDHRAALAGDRQIKDASQKLAAVSKQLDLLSYESVLERGFALVLDAQGVPLRQASKVKLGSLLDIHLAKGDKLGARVETTSTAEESVRKGPKNASKSKNERTKNKTKNSQQGKLFE